MPSKKSNTIIYYETKNSFGFYAEEGLPVEKIIQEIQRLNSSNSN